MSAEVSPRVLPTDLAAEGAGPSPTKPVEGDEAQGEAEVHPAGAHQKGVFRWGYFLVLNGISAVIAIAVFIAIVHGEAIDPYMMGTYEWLLAHPMMTSAMAFSPLVASMLVGWGYSQRARKRKAAAAAALARSAELAGDREATLVAASSPASSR